MSDHQVLSYLDHFGRRKITRATYSFVSISEMSRHEQNQTAVSNSSQFLTNISVAVAALVRNLRIDAKRRSSK